MCRCGLNSRPEPSQGGTLFTVYGWFGGLLQGVALPESGRSNSVSLNRASHYNWRGIGCSPRGCSTMVRPLKHDTNRGAVYIGAGLGDVRFSPIADLGGHGLLASLCGHQAFGCRASVASALITGLIEESRSSVRFKRPSGQECSNSEIYRPSTSCSNRTWKASRKSSKDSPAPD